MSIIVFFYVGNYSNLDICKNLEHKVLKQFHLNMREEFLFL